MEEGGLRGARGGGGESVRRGGREGRLGLGCKTNRQTNKQINKREALLELLKYFTLFFSNVYKLTGLGHTWLRAGCQYSQLPVFHSWISQMVRTVPSHPPAACPLGSGMWGSSASSEPQPAGEISFGSQ